MAAINHPILYQRDYSRDVPQPMKDDTSCGWSRKAVAALPLLALHRSCRAPLSMALSGARVITQMKAVLKAVERKDMTQAAYQFFHSCSTAAAFGFLFFHPVLSYTTTSFSDLINHMDELKAFVCAGDAWSACNAFSKGMLDGLFLASILYGSIEIIVLCATIQIISELHNSSKHFKNGDYFEGFCQGILAAAHVKQAIPQYQLLQWKYETAPLLEGTLRRNDQGFVYLDIPDEQIFSLLKYCGKTGIEPPPYFKEGMAGGHISVIAATEKTGQMAKLGQKFSFRISHADSFDWGTKKIHLIAVACPELEQVRLEQGLSRRLSGDHDFHITYGIEKT
jgi:hypothetical protein